MAVFLYQIYGLGSNSGAQPSVVSKYMVPAGLSDWAAVVFCPVKCQLQGPVIVPYVRRLRGHDTPHGAETSTMTPVHIPAYIFPLAGDTCPASLGVSQEQYMGMGWGFHGW